MPGDYFKPELESIQPERNAWGAIAPASVACLFTCRTGGVSSGPYGGADGIMGLNLAEHTGDAKGCARMNRSILSQRLPADPKWLTQVHGTTVIEADAVEDAPEADASFTTTPGVVCVVMTADCLPVLIAEKKGRIVAAVHAGWKGLAHGIIQKTVEALREKLGDSSAEFAVWLAPRIGADDFEVGGEVLEAMKTCLPQAEKAFRPKGEGKYLADLSELAIQALELVSVPRSDVVDCGLSTYSDKTRFYSRRRDGERSGRHAALIWIKSPA